MSLNKKTNAVSIVKGLLVWLFLYLLWEPPRINAVVFYSTGDPAYNTVPPSGALTNSGWQYQGLWQSFLGTTISTNLFITARHVGGQVGGVFIFRGVSYYTQAYWDDAASDLRIWQVCGRFPIYASLYTNTNEQGKGLVVFGRGTRRGSEVRVNDVLKGWQLGTADGVQRWGENVVSGIVNDNTGPLLKAAFNAGTGTNEAFLTSGDSGGAVFINDSGAWKLAGINYATDGPYNTTNTGSGFAAAIFDEGGLYLENQGQWIYRMDLPQNIPGAFYATRVSTRVTWINGVVNQSSAPAIESGAAVTGPMVRLLDVVVDAEAKTIMVPLGAGSQFFRLRDCLTRRFKRVSVQGATVIMQYE